MLQTYVLKASAEKLNVLNVDHGGITPIEKFYGITTDVYLKNHHTWVFPVYVLDAGFKGNIY